MEVSSNHHRDSSLSSLGSLYSADLNLTFDDEISCESYAKPLRTSHGTEMAIIAATSPEIKALNLSSAPHFPQGFGYHHRTDSSDTTVSSLSTGYSNSGSLRVGTLSPLLHSLEDTGSSPGLPRYIQRRSLGSDDTDDLIESFQLHCIDSVGACKPTKTVSTPKKRPDFFFDDKENIHPNLQQLSRCAHGPSPRFNYKPKRRNSLHRRGSYESLPSPAEIGQSPRVVRRASIDAFPFLPKIETPTKTRRVGHHRRLPSSYALGTGFR